LLMLTLFLCCRFLLENLYLDEHVRYVLTVYPVVVLWLVGSVTESISPGSHIHVFAGTRTALGSGFNDTRPGN